MKKAEFLILGSVILATILGIYGQDMAYFIGDMIETAEPLYALTILTVSSLLLFGATPIFTFKIARKKVFVPYLLVNGVLGIPISLFSIFVLAMWWG